VHFELCKEKQNIVDPTVSVFPKVNWSWMDIRSSKGVRITGPSIMFTVHLHTVKKWRQRLFCLKYGFMLQTRNHPGAHFRVPSNITTYFEPFYWTKPIFTRHGTCPTDLENDCCVVIKKFAQLLKFDWLIVKKQKQVKAGTEIWLRMDDLVSTNRRVNNILFFFAQFEVHSQTKKSLKN
jgi:hypothetical protein